MTETVPFDIKSYMGAQRWKVSVDRIGTGYHVSPHKGLMVMRNWGLSLKPNRLSGFRLIRSVRREYPNEVLLEKAVRECQVWCERMNEAEDHATAVLRHRQS